MAIIDQTERRVNSLHRQGENSARKGPVEREFTAPINQECFDLCLPMVNDQTLEHLLPSASG